MSEVMVLCWKPVDCSLQVGVELLPQVKELKYLLVLVTSEGKMEREMDRWVSATSKVMQMLYWSVVVKTTERTTSQIQVARMSFIHWVTGLSPKDGSDIREFGVKG